MPLLVPEKGKHYFVLSNLTAHCYEVPGIRISFYKFPGGDIAEIVALCDLTHYSHLAEVAEDKVTVWKIRKMLDIANERVFVDELWDTYYWYRAFLSPGYEDALGTEEYVTWYQRLTGEKPNAV